MTDEIKSVVAIGGDMRMIHAAKRLSERYGCTAAGFGAPTETSGYTLPEAALGPLYDAAVLPVFTGGAKEIRCPYANRTCDIGILSRLLRKGGVVFSGGTFPELERFCERNGFRLYDYLTREEFAVRNAVLTAEGAVMTAVNETDRALCGSGILIIGYGRIGKLCARYFSELGARVTVAARRKSDLAWAEASGCTAADITDESAFDSALANAETIINTAPAILLTGKRAAAVRKGALLIELASIPCTEPDSGIRTVRAGGLPGKTAPVTAGEIIADTIENILRERRNENDGS